MEDQTLKILRQASNIVNQVNKVQNEINGLNAQIVRTKRMDSGSYGLIITAAFVGWLPGLIFSAINCSIFSVPREYRGFINFAAAVLSYIAFMILAFIKDTARGRQKQQQKANRIALLQKEINSKNEWISTFLKKHSDVVSCIPSNYLYPIAIDYFIEVLSNGRAESFKEAMNLYEEQLHRWKIEDMTKTTMIAQQQTAANSAAIRTSSAINAAANVANLLRR